MMMFRILCLLMKNILPVTNAERLAISPISCSPPAFNNNANISRRHDIRYAHYFNGTEEFSGKVKDLMANFKGVRVAGTGAKIVLDAVIDEKGNIGSFVSSDTFDHNISRQLISYMEM